ncbi:hypothetical protein N431DRAFT_558714 [Stipitochalara longipes BDJ]|nr:hypothetical protein N431DRAFT_558714 [Stipitochalara longipes BDJ]
MGRGMSARSWPAVGLLLACCCIQFCSSQALTAKAAMVELGAALDWQWGSGLAPLGSLSKPWGARSRVVRRERTERERELFWGYFGVMCAEDHASFDVFDAPAHAKHPNASPAASTLAQDPGICTVAPLVAGSLSQHILASWKKGKFGPLPQKQREA